MQNQEFIDRNEVALFSNTYFHIYFHVYASPVRRICTLSAGCRFEMADPWEPDDVPVSPARPLAPAAPLGTGALPRVRRGRPPGRNAQERLAARRAHAAAYARQQRQAAAAPLTEHSCAALAPFLRPLGSEAQQAVMRAAASADEAPGAQAPRVQRLVEHCLGPLPRPTPETGLTNVGEGRPGGGGRYIGSMFFVS